MPNRKTSYYDLDDVIGTIGPGPYPATASFSGYGDSGGIEYSIEGDAHEFTAGADGFVAVSKNNNEVVIATITCMAGSFLARDLSVLAQAQHKSTPSVGVPFNMLDPNLGDEIFEPQAYFQTFAPPSKEDVQGEREFDIILPHARRSIVLATAAP